MSRRTLAYVALAVSTVLWPAMFAVPLTSLGTGEKVALATGLYGGSYIFFFLAIAAVGKEGYAAMKERLLDWFRRRRGRG